MTYAQVRDHLLEESAHGGLPYFELIDARTYKPEFSAGEVRDIVALLRCLGESNELGPTAIVVGSPVGFGMLRMLEILSEDVCAIRPFWTIEEAETWLQQLRMAQP